MCWENINLCQLGLTQITSFTFFGWAVWGYLFLEINHSHPGTLIFAFFVLFFVLGFLVFLFCKWVGYCLWIKLHIYELSMVHGMKGSDSTWSDFQPLHLPPHLTVTIHFVKYVSSHLISFWDLDFVTEKSITESQNTQNFECAHAFCNLPPLYNCTCVAWKMHSFSTNQKHMISFSCVLLEI